MAYTLRPGFTGCHYTCKFGVAVLSALKMTNKCNNGGLV